MSSKRTDLSESAIEEAVCEFAQGNGWLVRKVEYIGRRGAPDRIFIKDGHVAFVEFKAPGEKPNIQQRREHKRLRAHGAEVHVIDNVGRGLWLFK